MRKLTTQPFSLPHCHKVSLAVVRMFFQPLTNRKKYTEMVFLCRNQPENLLCNVKADNFGTEKGL